MSKVYTKHDITQISTIARLYDKIDSDLSQVTKWGPVELASGSAPSMEIEIWNYGCRISYVDNLLSEKIDRKTIDEFAADKINYSLGIINDRSNPNMIRTIVLDDKGELLGYQTIKDGDYYYVQNNKIPWMRLDFQQLANLVEKNAGKNNYIIWRIGKHLMQCGLMYPFKILAGIVLNDYCDNYVPTVGGAREKVTKEGFSFTCYFLWRVLFDDTKVLANKNVSVAYDELSENGVMPYIPIKFMAEDIEKVNTKKIDKMIKALRKDWKSASEKEEDKEIDLINDALSQVNTALENSIDKTVDASRISNLPVIRLSDILSENFLVSNYITEGILYTEELEVEIDCDIKTDKPEIYLRNVDVAFGLNIFGTLQLIIPDEVLSENDLEYIEEFISESKGIGLQIIKSNNIKDFEAYLGDYLKEAKK